MAHYSIKDLENLSGIKAHTIRIWEKRYNLVSPERTSTNIRLYDDQDLKKLLNISILNRNGVKISKIANMQDDELREKINIITQNVSDSETQIERLCVAMIEIDEEKFDELLSKSIFQLGFEETVINIIYPFFVKIGVMWQTGTINPAQEHFISNLVRQKLLVAIDGQRNKLNKDSKQIMMFLPEGELHELGLLFYSYLAQRRGFKVIYLGQSVPFQDLIEVQEIRKTEFLLTSYYSTLSEKFIRDYTWKLAETFPKQRIFISGGYANEVLDRLPPNIELVANPEAFIQRVESLR
ncbi:MAG: MerR family transcriptional regulator [Bacteroidota bacterium]